MHIGAVVDSSSPSYLTNLSKVQRVRGKFKQAEGDNCYFLIVYKLSVSHYIINGLLSNLAFYLAMFNVLK